MLLPSCSINACTILTIHRVKYHLLPLCLMYYHYYGSLDHVIGGGVCYNTIKHVLEIIYTHGQTLIDVKKSSYDFEQHRNVGGE